MALTCCLVVFWIGVIGAIIYCTTPGPILRGEEAFRG